MTGRHYLVAASLSTYPALAHARGVGWDGALAGLLIIVAVVVLAYDKRLRQNVGASLFLFGLVLCPALPALLFLAEGQYELGLVFLGLTILLIVWMFRKK